MEHASQGGQVLIVSDGLAPQHFRVNKGIVYMRSHAPTGLKSLQVSMVVFLGQPPEEVGMLCREMTRCCLEPVFLHCYV
jgi:hypothetical protein